MRSRIPRLPRRINPIAARLAAVAALMFVGSRIVAPVTLDLGSSGLQVRAVPRIPGGHTIVPLGPLGELRFATHTAPVDFEANLLIDPAATSLPGAQDIDVRSWRSSFVTAKIGWVALFGILAALLAVRGSKRTLAVASAAGAGASLLISGLVAYAAVGTFDLDGFGKPSYRGPVRDVPRIVALAREIGRDFPGTKRNIARAVEGLGRLRADLLAGAPKPAGQTIKLLIVADLQSNPVGLLIADRLAREFDVAAILDAGDVTERGTELEGEIFASFSSIDRPYIIAPGNHEDEAAIRRLSAIPHVRVVSETEDTADVNGVTILGAEDPNARSIEVDPRNELAREKGPVVCAHLVDRLRQTNADVLLIHDPKLGECAAADARASDRPLVFVWGHLHRTSVKVDGSVLSVSPGTSGANGVKSDNVAPYGFGLVELDASTHRAVSACLFAFDRPGELGRADCRILYPDEP